MLRKKQRVDLRVSVAGATAAAAAAGHSDLLATNINTLKYAHNSYMPGAPQVQHITYYALETHRETHVCPSPHEGTRIHTHDRPSPQER